MLAKYSRGTQVHVRIATSALKSYGQQKKKTTQQQLNSHQDANISQESYNTIEQIK